MLNDCGKKLMKPWMSVQNLVLALALIFCVALMKLTSSELASWVQAVGSIAAIWGAFSISNHQVRKQDELQHRENRNKARARLAVVKNVATYAQALSGFVENKPSVVEFIDVWTGTMSFTTGAAIESLRCLPAHDLGSDTQVLLYNEMLGAFAQLRKMAKNFADSTNHNSSATLSAYRDIQNQAVMIQGLWLDFQVYFYKDPV